MLIKKNVLLVSALMSLPTFGSASIGTNHLSDWFQHNGSQYEVKSGIEYISDEIDGYGGYGKTTNGITSDSHGGQKFDSEALLYKVDNHILTSDLDKKI